MAFRRAVQPLILRDASPQLRHHSLQMTAAEIIVEIVVWYGYAGCAVAAAFLLVGIDRIDPGAGGAYLFRVLLAPGVIVLWPLVLWIWLRREMSGRPASDETA